MGDYKILLTGPTGYVGGAILAALLSSEYGLVKKCTISCLVRGEDKARILASQGVRPILFNSLDETDVLARVASEHDVVIHAASGFHILSARALILGLAQRRKETGKEVHYIHTSGTSNVADRPITGEYHEKRFPLSDKDDIYSYEKMRDMKVPYAQRTTDIVVIETGLEVNVKTYILMSCSIYGIGTNPLLQLAHVPILIRLSLEAGQVAVVGDGKATWDHVHITDVSRLYELILAKILDGVDIPNGKKGIYFVEAGHHSWLELSQRIAEAGVTLHALKTTALQTLSLEEATKKLGNGWALLGEIGWASNSRTKGDLARELGWKPQKTRADFEAHFVDNWKAILASTKNRRSAPLGKAEMG
ncbi:hypothetical protein BKA61DRAFT_614899 [Leptodontidium sp. MPI-SDFR-AT-0119]|nr:hypothetical protein BKA61DRAFT_614899 [Leptodontidium sp. MPI-SDFR-AT-0119]